MTFLTSQSWAGRVDPKFQLDQSHCLFQNVRIVIYRWQFIRAGGLQPAGTHGASLCFLSQLRSPQIKFAETEDEVEVPRGTRTRDQAVPGSLEAFQIFVLGFFWGLGVTFLASGFLRHSWTFVMISLFLPKLAQADLSSLQAKCPYQINTLM